MTYQDYIETRELSDKKFTLQCKLEAEEKAYQENFHNISLKEKKNYQFSIEYLKEKIISIEKEIIKAII